MNSIDINVELVIERLNALTVREARFVQGKMSQKVGLIWEGSKEDIKNMPLLSPEGYTLLCSLLERFVKHKGEKKRNLEISDALFQRKKPRLEDSGSSKPLHVSQDFSRV